MDAHAAGIGSALQLEAQRSARASWERLRQRVLRWIGRPFSWLA